MKMRLNFMDKDYRGFDFRFLLSYFALMVSARFHIKALIVSSVILAVTVHQVNGRGFISRLLLQKSSDSIEYKKDASYIRLTQKWLASKSIASKKHSGQSFALPIENIKQPAIKFFQADGRHGAQPDAKIFSLFVTGLSPPHSFFS
jgi:hypothetical protein